MSSTAHDDRLAAGRVADSWAKAGTTASLTVATCLLAAKIWAWLTTDSAAVLGSAADSGLDLFGSAIAFVALRYAMMPADADHRFGHQKAEGLASLLQAVVITGSALFVTYESIQRLIWPQPLTDAAAGVWVLASAAGVTVALVAFQTLAIKRSGSLLVEGDRAHYLGDVIANLGALAGVLLAARFGILRADGVAGLLAAAFLFWSVREIAKNALPQVMDQELPDEDRAAIRAIVDADAQVRGHHALRTRRAGRRRYVQLHLELDPDMTLRRAHEIADRVERTVEAAFPDTDVIVHMDPDGVDHHDGPPDTRG